MTVQNKLFMGFGAVLVMVALVSINNVVKMGNVSNIEHRLIDVRLPTVMAGMHLQDGIHLSLAGLRGYMILGKNPVAAAKFKAERQSGWDMIDTALAEMDEFSKHWSDPKNLEALQEMEGYIEELRTAQQEVEDISHTSENIPAFNMLQAEAGPRAAKILGAVSAIIDEEAALSATPQRKKLLKLLADSRGSFAVGMADIRAYLLSGDTRFADNFDDKWEINEARFKQISSLTGLFNAKQAGAWNTYKSVRAEFAPLPEKMFDLRGSREWNLANYWLGTKAAPKASAIMKILNEMRISQDKLALTDEEVLESETSSMKTIMIIGTLIAIGIGVFVSIFISRMITLPLKEVVTRAKAIASGDLTGAALKSKGDDEIAELTNNINDMSASLQDVIQQVSSSTTQLAAAANQLTSTAERTSVGMESQSSETEQVATAMNQMTATVQEVARSATEASASAGEADQEATEGKRVVEQNMESIHELAAGIEHASATINKLGEDTKSVDNIVEVISGIADQTNLLALNAAIEAARAGEQGRGFAVVADEVRTLAARTQESTEEIRSMLDRLKVGADEAVTAMDAGHKQAQTSVEQANTASESLAAITNAVAAISDMNSQIATAAEEQSAVADEMNRSIVQISTEAESALQNTRETGTAAQQVGDLSTHLQEMVAQFKLN